MSNEQASTPTLSAQPRFREAYERIRDELARLSDDALATINIDIPNAITTALGALPKLQAERPRIARELPYFDLDRFDKLEAYTLTLAYTHGRQLAASAPPETLRAVAAEAAQLRALLLRDTEALAARGLIDATRLRELKGPQAYQSLAFDLFTLVTIIGESWPDIAARTAIEPADLERAERLADQLLTSVARRKQGPTEIAQAADERRRAFSLFADAYDDARRAIGYLHWRDGDADKIAPSLYRGRGNVRGKNPPSPAVAQPPSPPQPHGDPPTQHTNSPNAEYSMPGTVESSRIDAAAYDRTFARDH